MRIRGKISRAGRLLWGLAALGVFCGCSFEYGELIGGDTGPDIIMRDVEYVRVRGGNPQVRFRAEEAERWEKQQTMNLNEFSFEQFEHPGEEVGARGIAGNAYVELETGNIDMTGGVRLEVESEDFIIETATLSWDDSSRRLSAGEKEIVDIQRTDGTFFQGRGFSADVRKRTWNFSGNVEGSYVHEDTEDDAEAEQPDGDTETDDAGDET